MSDWNSHGRIRIGLVAELAATAAVFAMVAAGPAWGSGIRDLPSLLEAMGSESAPRSVEEFLANPELSDEFRRDVFLVKGSKSLQVSTDREPRALMSNASGSLVLAFIGNPRPQGPVLKHGYDEIEVVAFNQEAADYELYSIQFYADSKPKVEGPNPKFCMNCHRGPSPVGGFSRPWSEQEWQIFVREKCEGRSEEPGARVGHERYRHLDCDAIREQNTGPEDSRLRLGGKMSAHLRYKFVRRIRATPEFARFRFAYYGALATCPEIEEFVPPGMGERDGVAPWDKAQMDRLLLRFLGTRRQRDAAERDRSRETIFKNYQLEAYAKLKFLLDPQQISEPGEDSLWGIRSFHIAYHEEASLVGWLEELVQGDIEMKDIDVSWDELRGGKPRSGRFRSFCGKMKKKSLNALGS